MFLFEFEKEKNLTAFLMVEIEYYLNRSRIEILEIRVESSSSGLCGIYLLIRLVRKKLSFRDIMQLEKIQNDLIIQSTSNHF